MALESTSEVVFPTIETVNKLVFDDLTTHIVVVGHEPMCYSNSLDVAVQCAEEFAKDLVREHTEREGKWNVFGYRREEGKNIFHITKQSLGYLYNSSVQDFLSVSVQTISHATIQTTITPVEKSE